MPFRSVLSGNVYAVRWQVATSQDVTRMEQEVASYRRVSKIPLHGLAIVGEEVPPPDDHARNAMGNSMKTLLESLETMHTVIEGRGFKNTILRSAMTGMVLLGGKRGRVFVHGTVSEALYALSEVTNVSVDLLQRQLGDTRILEKT